MRKFINSPRGYFHIFWLLKLNQVAQSWHRNMRLDFDVFSRSSILSQIEPQQSRKLRKYANFPSRRLYFVFLLQPSLKFASINNTTKVFHQPDIQHSTLDISGYSLLTWWWYGAELSSLYQKEFGLWNMSKVMSRISHIENSCWSLAWIFGMKFAWN